MQNRHTYRETKSIRGCLGLRELGRIRSDCKWVQEVMEMFWVTRFEKMTSPDSKRWLHNTVNIFKVTNFKRVNFGNCSGSPGVRTLCFHCRGPQVRSLAREIRSRLLRGADKNK